MVSKAWLRRTVNPPCSISQAQKPLEVLWRLYGARSLVGLLRSTEESFTRTADLVERSVFISLVVCIRATKLLRFGSFGKFSDPHMDLQKQDPPSSDSPPTASSFGAMRTD